MATSYAASEFRIYYGNGSVLHDLTNSVQSLQIAGVGQVSRSRRLGTAGVTADGVTAGLSGRFSGFYDDVTKAALALRRGILFIGREDAGYGWAFSALLTASPVRFPSQAAVGVNLQFTQSDASEAVVGVYDNAGAYTIASGNIGYLANTRAGTIARVTASGTLPAGAAVIHGPRLVAEGLA